MGKLRSGPDHSKNRSGFSNSVTYSWTILVDYFILLGEGRAMALSIGNEDMSLLSVACGSQVKCYGSLAESKLSFGVLSLFFSSFFFNTDVPGCYSFAVWVGLSVSSCVVAYVVLMCHGIQYSHWLCVIFVTYSLLVSISMGAAIIWCFLKKGVLCSWQLATSSFITIMFGLGFVGLVNVVAHIRQLICENVKLYPRYSGVVTRLVNYCM